MNKQAYLYVNYVCNSRCIFCASDWTNTGSAIRQRSFAELTSELDRQAETCSRLLISGGEPTVHKELIDILNYAATKFTQVNLATNGILLSNYAFAERVIQTGINRVAIPFYHTDRHEFNRLVGNKNAYDSVITAIQNLSQLKNKYRFNINLKILFMRPNYLVNPDIVDLLKQIFPALRFMSIATLRIGKHVLDNRDELVVDLNQARPYISETVRRMLKHNIQFAFDYVPLCTLEPDILMQLLKERKLHRRQTISTIIRPEATFYDKAFPYYESSACSKCDVEAYCSRLSRKNFEHMNYDSQLHSVSLPDL